jgi:hypothetical protein
VPIKTKLRRCFTLLFLSTVGYAGVASAAPDKVLAEVPFGTSLGTHAIVTSGNVELCGGLPEGCNPNLSNIFAPITSASVGTTIWLDGSAPHFAALSDLITNGVSDPFSVMFNAGAGSGKATFEPGFFGGQVGPNGVDLGGFVIHRIGFRVDQASLVSPGSDAAGDGIWTDASVQGAFLFEGTCATQPSIATLPPVIVSTSSLGPTPVTLTPPAAGSACNDAPTVTGRVVSTFPPIPVVGGQVSLRPGVYVVEWTVDDGFNAVSSPEIVIVLFSHHHH